MTDQADAKPSDRISAALAGELPMKDLDAAERAVLHETIGQRLAHAVATTRWDLTSLPKPVRHVALDEHGHLREYHPDGSVTDLPGHA